MRCRLKTLAFVLVATAFTISKIEAGTYSVSPEQSIIGEVQIATTKEGDTAISLAKDYNLGFNSIKSANPSINFKRGFLPGTQLTMPNQHLLPAGKRQGIVINLPEMRLYYFPKNSQEVHTYPIGIGKIGNTIPITNTVITRKAENPVWIPTPNIRKFNLEQGIVLPKVIEAGPDNPLGRYAIYT